MSSSAINLAGMLAPTQFRNKIINGNFDIWQRGITFGTHDDSLVYGPIAGGIGGTGSNGLANIGYGDLIKNNPYVSPLAQRGGGQDLEDIIKDQAYTADRWRLMNRAGWKGHVIRKEFDWSDSDDLLPSGASPARYYMEHSVEEESNNSSMSQRIEDVTIFNNEKITVSFYARSVDRADSNVNRIRAHLVAYTKCTGSNIDNGGGSDSPVNSPLHEVPSNYQLYNDNSGDLQVLSGNWQKYTYTFTIPQMAGKIDGNGNPVTPGEGFWVINLKPISSGGEAWLGAVHYAQVQVEKRDDTTEFEILPPGIELQRCQRYFQKSLPLDIEPGHHQGTASPGPYENDVPDDAITFGWGSDGRQADNMYYEFPGTVTVGYRGTASAAVSGSVKFHSSMRTIPEVILYASKVGAGVDPRGMVYSEEESTPREVKLIRAITEHGFNDIGAGFYGDQDFAIAFTWTADAEL
jgi:hypothetical protein